MSSKHGAVVSVLFFLVAAVSIIGGGARGSSAPNLVREVEYELTATGLAVVVTAGDVIQYRQVEGGDGLYSVELSNAVVKGPGENIPVNVGGVDRIEVSQKRAGPDFAVWVTIVKSGPAEVKRTMLSPREMLLIVTPPAPEEPASHDYIAETSFVIDLHNDVITKIYEQENMEIFEQKKLQASWPQLRGGGLRGAFFAVWIPTDKGKGHEDTLIEIFYKLIYKHRDEMAFAGSYADVQRNLAEDKFSAFLAIEGGTVIDSAERLDYFHKRGVRYLTLTWNDTNLIADAAKDVKTHGGLSPFGETIVRRMNELGMLVDVSHVSDDTVDDVLRVSADPVIASHSNCYSVYPHVRNLKDRHIEGICGGGGVIGMNFYSAFLGRQRHVPLDAVLAQIDYLVEKGGIDCVALGSDFDGRIRPPVGLENMSKLDNLTKALQKRGYTTEEIKKMYGLNFLRVLKRVVDE